MTLPFSADIFTVSRLNTVVRRHLEQDIGLVWLSAEISNFSRPVSGHWYFTLKDKSAQVRCAMFRGSNNRVCFSPQNGQQVLVCAAVTLYEPRGDYQLIIETMLEEGEGLLRLQFEQLKQKLTDEGLFQERFKQALPIPVKRLGIITSPTGAALYDILHILGRRDPALPIVIYPAIVQGTEGAPSIVRAIEVANLRDECDVIILGRGGGSREDLACFNDENVARAIFASRIPIVSAVGHEIDVSIADFVADLRASTPSAAAELVSRDQEELSHRLDSYAKRLVMTWKHYLAKLERLSTFLSHRLQQQHPQLRLARRQIKLTQWRYRMNGAMLFAFNQDKQNFGLLVARLEAVSPLAVLARGYSVTVTGEGITVKEIKQVSIGDNLKIRLNDGWLESQVFSVKPIV